MLFSNNFVACEMPSNAVYYGIGWAFGLCVILK